ncbi:molecular chaperone [Enterobacter bugandensis]|uniref:fimbrial biogenesis chaperone n=1 Tax=Enterobacter TaxID=547 RepID=UPI0015E16CAB|nr:MULTISPECIES: molecular chaperone [Enterobacter]EKS6888879.1 molecular chaperone [Enterobacter bugandensis]EKS6930054.1 molecular chaperone [Enterobacter bugandensis]EKS7121863.1 molecular chaperone [Enterobacter bugandensis]EKV5172335.1 molecular chaperone [Enterobacter bugandensis]MBD0814039.1 molecular chaperone [Enterobacter sp. E12]
MNEMKLTLIAKGFLCLLCLSTLAHATVSPDRTRIIFNETDKSTTVKLTNQSKTMPYLAQSWIEDKNSVKTREYITPLPPLLRLEAGEQSQIRLMGQPTLAQLPKDRESLFYYNMREIPPRSDAKNVMQLAMQSRLKLFWRPKAIVLKEGQAVPMEKVDIIRTASGITIKNRTPYHVSVGYIGTDGKTLLPGASGFMVAPFSENTSDLKNLPAKFQIGYIGDYGGLNMFSINCTSVQPVCHSEIVKKG